MTSLMSSEKSRFWSLEELGRIQLSQHFYLRDVLYSEIAAAFSLPNVPDDLELAVANGRPSPQARLHALRHLHPEVVRGRPGAGLQHAWMPSERRVRPTFSPRPVKAGY